MGFYIQKIFFQYAEKIKKKQPKYCGSLNFDNKGMYKAVDKDII